MANTSRWITGEEASVSIIAPLFQRDRIQPSHFSSNFVGYLIFRVGHAIGFDSNLYDGRTWKTLTLAIVLPLIYVLLRRLGIGEPSAVLAAVVFASTAAFQAFSWVAIEAGLDLVFGVGALIAATRRSVSATALSGILVACAGLAYPPGLAFGLPALYLLSRDGRWVARWSAAAAGFAGTICAALMSLRPPRAVLIGGGTQPHPGLSAALNTLWHDGIAGGTGSYYYLTHTAAVPLLIWVAVAAGVVAIARGRRMPADVIVAGLLIVVSLGIAIVGGGPPGVRRALPAVVGIAVLAAHGIPWRAAIVAIVAAVALAVSVNMGIGQDLVHDGLPRDWAFVGLATDDVNADIDLLAQMPLADVARHITVTGSEPVRTLALVEAARARMRLPTEAFRARRLEWWQCRGDAGPGAAIDPFRLCHW